MSTSKEMLRSYSMLNIAVIPRSHLVPYCRCQGRLRPPEQGVVSPVIQLARPSDLWLTSITTFSDKIVAMNSKQYKKSWCGKTVTIKNKKTGKQVKAKIMDRCPGCGYGSLDLTKGAFKALGNLE